MKTAIIIGAGPAGLTAAYELLLHSDIKPIILEKSGDIGGLSKTINYKGNRIDIGGHRFFSKSDRVMQWWLNILKLENINERKIVLGYQNKTTELNMDQTEPDNRIEKSGDENEENVMLVRKRVSRIYYLKQFFSYPISLSLDTIRKLGILKVTRIFFSYLQSKIKPRRPELSLEDFFINRFGSNLYNTFFKDYTEKVWGRPCKDIPAEWGAQRIKELSITKAVKHALRTQFRKTKTDLGQKDTETTLIQYFLYPKYGPGQLWEEVAKIILSKGGEIHHHSIVEEIHLNNGKIIGVSATNPENGGQLIFNCDYLLSTMPVKDLIKAIGSTVPESVCSIADGLQYRDFITVGLLVNRLKKEGPLMEDNWIYIQEREVKVGRLQIFNNWSPFMVKDPETVWLGLEYFCNKEDDFWKLDDNSISSFAIDELVKIDLITEDQVLDHTVIRMEKTYPAYFGTYDKFDKIREYTNGIPNLYLIGRNGMHKYNNADHSMLTAMEAVDNIISGKLSKDNIWAVNTEDEYQG